MADKTKEQDEEVFIYEGGNQVVPADVVRMRTHPNCKRIEKEALVGRRNLSEVELLEGVEEILEGAFRGCEWIKILILPSTLKTIYDLAFAGCINLVYVKWNERLGKIGRDAFKETAIKYVPLPSPLTSLGNSAFGKCWNLKEVAMQKGLRKISRTFAGCFNLERIGKPEHVVLGKGFVPSAIEGSVKIESDYKAVWKEVFEKNEQVYDQWKKHRQAEKDTKGKIDVKPNAQTLLDGEVTTTEGRSISRLQELDEIAGKLQNALKERDTLQAEKDRLVQESKASISALQAEKDALVLKSETIIKTLQAEKEHLEQESKAKTQALQLDMETKLQQAKDEIESLQQSIQKLRQDNGDSLKTREETDAKLQSLSRSLENEEAERAEIMEKLQVMTRDCHALKTENARLKKEKDDKEAQLLKATGKCGALEERNKTLRKKFKERGGHESVVSEDGEPKLEGLSIGLDSECPAGRFKASTVSGTPVLAASVKEELMEPPRKRQRSVSEETSRKFKSPSRKGSPPRTRSQSALEKNKKSPQTANNTKAAAKVRGATKTFFSLW